MINHKDVWGSRKFLKILRSVVGLKFQQSQQVLLKKHFNFFVLKINYRIYIFNKLLEFLKIS